MTTDFQTARFALGVRLRELRLEAGLTGRNLAERLGWQPSKVSRLENGKQTPAAADLTAWAAAVGHAEVAAELKGRLAGLDTKYRSWRRQLAGGHRVRQEAAITETRATQTIRGAEVTRVPGLFQTAEYARYGFEASSEFRQIPTDVEAAVRARIRRQEALYEPGKRFRFLLWEGALYVRTCPAGVHAAQMDRLVSLIGLDTVELGIVPFDAQLRRTPSHGFWIYDQRLVIVETISTEMWLDDEESIRTYGRAWDWMAESAVFGRRAQRVIDRARNFLGPA
ncbi:helix-turn-helix domain-containing protein [Streptomyces clavuligerus]|uniref:Regulatory protein n=1 Tax=Streptomyces clavuligerus TaxID=1901 RepID=B5GUI4_STRCL|nr:helix-turn-helix transcriptional regulator [Streptomyces clavuligerus]EDY49980.1 regulatory protein [Streptomyces clavuligerus]EFG03694.1 Regulatory protein [Streptomyces clavuligerus]MBY6307758.1 helix-turn-helix transcriptional regulator [Streptomyces clavuligerus]QCS09697.1 XRE family transcriptional regulator [Streptomyces clavuligerus]QPJ98261.1 helix-turn-helix domain-containing protein [Streptomyces clavuligerus]